MAATKKILTSLHGKLIGLSHDGKLVVKGRTLPAMNDTGVMVQLQGAPTALNATGTLTAAAIKSGIVTSTTAAAVAATLDTGTVMDASFTGDDALAIGESFDWSVINTGPNTFTVTASAGHTVEGAGAVATAISAVFRTRKTAANTFITYRIG